jgi:hypothetical protein
LVQNWFKIGSCLQFLDKRLLAKLAVKAGTRKPIFRSESRQIVIQSARSSVARAEMRCAQR